MLMLAPDKKKKKKSVPTFLLHLKVTLQSPPNSTQTETRLGGLLVFNLFSVLNADVHFNNLPSFFIG